MNIHFRLETPNDYHAVEELTREAFWKFWEPDRKICDEHLLVHRLRTAPTFVPELDFVAEVDGRNIGHIIYTKSKIVDAAGNDNEMLTFGPLSVLPEFQSKGIGKALMLHSFEEAKQLGYRAVLIFGHPDYYTRVGFRRAAEFGITTADGKNYDPFMAYVLYENALEGIHGRYLIDPIHYQLLEADVLEFDKRFPQKEPFVPTPFHILLDSLEPDARFAMEGAGCKSMEMMTSLSQREISLLPGIDGNAIATIRSVLSEHNIKWGEGGEVKRQNDV